MTESTSPHFQHVSDTAMIVARIRGLESQRPDRLFNDTLALRFSGSRGEQLAQAAKKNLLLKTIAKSMNVAIVVRTQLIDEIITRAVMDEGITCVVNLGAGLDARPYRLDLPKDLLWMEADFGPVIDHKEKLAEGEIPRCQVERLKIDISNRKSRDEFFAMLAESGEKVLVLTEGLLLYLSEDEVRDLAAAIEATGTIRKWVTDVNSPLTLQSMEKFWGLQLGQNVQFKFGPENAGDFFRRLGWKVKQELAVFEEAGRLNRKSPLTAVRKTLSVFLGESFRKRIRHSSMVLELEAP